MSVHAAFELPRSLPANPICRLALRITREIVPDAEELPRAAPFPAFDPLAPSRTACLALVKRYVSLSREDTLPVVLSIARDKVVARCFHAEPQCSGATLGLTMLLAMNGRRFVPGSLDLRIDAMAFAMIRCEAAHGSVEGWRLYEDGFTRAEVEEHGWQAAQIAEAIGRVIDAGGYC